MTRSQRLELLKQIEKDIHVCSLESTLLEDAKSCAIHSAIEELEQEPILDKIRAEIHATAEMHEDGDYYLRDEWIDEIFDKYKAESEGT